eukprot:scaffold279134_cov18-Tisochrysis_lutea.AAC.2
MDTSVFLHQHQQNADRNLASSAGPPGLMLPISAGYMIPPFMPPGENKLPSHDPTGPARTQHPRLIARRKYNKDHDDEIAILGLITIVLSSDQGLESGFTEFEALSTWKRANTRLSSM